MPLNFPLELSDTPPKAKHWSISAIIEIISGDLEVLIFTCADYAPDHVGCTQATLLPQRTRLHKDGPIISHVRHPCGDKL